MTDGPAPGPTTAAAQWNDVEQRFSRPGEVWSVTCFVVAAGHRRSGVAAALQCAAVEHAKLNGSDVVEGYPVDRGQRPKAVPADLPWLVCSHTKGCTEAGGGRSW